MLVHGLFPAPPAVTTTTSPDGRWLAFAKYEDVLLVDLGPPDERELAVRLWATRPDPWWHTEEAQRLEAEGQLFAAAQHRALAANLPPAALAQVKIAVAIYRSGEHAEAVAALLGALAAQPVEDAPIAP
jgi:hypothetical protein